MEGIGEKQANRKSQIPKKSTQTVAGPVETTTKIVIQPPPDKQVFERSLRSDKIFMENRLSIENGNLKKTNLKKSVSRDHLSVGSRETLLDKELAEKDNQIKDLLEKQLQLESDLHELKCSKIKQDEQNEQLVRETELLREKLTINQKQIESMNKKIEEEKFNENNLTNLIQNILNDQNENDFNLNEIDEKSAKILLLFNEFKIKKEKESKILNSQKLDLESKLTNCIQNIDLLNQDKEKFSNDSNEKIKNLESDLQLIKKEQAHDKEIIKSLELNLNNKEQQLQESLVKQTEVEETLEMLNDFKDKSSHNDMLSSQSIQELKEKLNMLEQKYSEEKEKNENLTKNLQDRETEFNFLLSSVKSNVSVVKLNSQVKNDYFDDNFNQLFKSNKTDNISDYVDPNELLLVDNQSFSYKKDLLKNESEKKYQLAAIPPGLKAKRSFKIVFLGDSGVGKTSFIKRVCQNVFEDSLSATVGLDYDTRLIYVNNQVASLKFWDTAGQERYRSIVKSYYRDTDCFICMFDVNEERSFLNLRSWIATISDTSEENFLLVLVGNKIDLNKDENLRPIRYREAETLAKLNDGLYFELSTKEGNNVFETIEAITKALFLKFPFERVKDNFRNTTELETKKKKCFFF